MLLKNSEIRKIESSRKFLDWSLSATRISIGVIFVWFGLLKFYEPNPVRGILEASFPFLADPPGIYILGIFEILIGIGLIINFLPTVIHIFLIGHLLATFSVFILGPEIMFNPYFPFLTLAGEFVVKNLALAMGGIATLYVGRKK